MVRPQVSVVIPCFNENNRILPVISAIKQSTYSLEIIVVDDGSDLATKKILSTVTGIRLVTHSHNLGKAQALKSGVLASKGKIMAFVDADLQHFTYRHFDSLVGTFVKSKVSMLLGDRDKEVFYSRLSAFSLAFTGERLFWRRQLIKHLSLFQVKNYLIEASLNRYFFHQCPVTAVFLPQVGQVEKIKKQGIGGFGRDINMCLNIIRFLGPKEFLFQLHYAHRLRRHQFGQDN